MELSVDNPDNEIDIAADFEAQPAHVLVSGPGNRLRIGPGCRCLPGCTIRLGGRSSISIGAHGNLARLNAIVDRGGVLRIGSDAGFTFATLIQVPELATVSIGRGCLFANDTQILASDMHSILDLASGNRINPARDIILDERVWLGERAVVLKGVHIGAGSIIGLGSVVGSDIPASTLAAGVPARVLRTNVAWQHALV